MSARQNSWRSIPLWTMEKCSLSRDKLWRGQLSHVSDFKYLGCWIATTERDFRIRKAEAWAACHKLKKMWKSFLRIVLKILLFVATWCPFCYMTLRRGLWRRGLGNELMAVILECLGWPSMWTESSTWRTENCTKNFLVPSWKYRSVGWGLLETYVLHRHPDSWAHSKPPPPVETKSWC